MTATRTASTSPATLRVATFSDYDQIHRLESTFFDNSLTTSDRRALFEHNPLWPRLERTWPIGWVLESEDGHVVERVTNIPSGYVFEGEQVLCATATAGPSWTSTGATPRC